jgi:hypothetical protein
MVFKVIAIIENKHLERRFLDAKTAAAYASSIQTDADHVELLIDQSPENSSKCADESRDPKSH